MKKFNLILLFISIFTSSNIKSNWFVTWNEPNYMEWAKKIENGYLLHMIHVKKDKTVVVSKAKLIMGDEDLPGFTVIEKFSTSTIHEAMKKVEAWRAESEEKKS